MDTELLSRCNDNTDARHDTASRVDLRRRKLWAVAYVLRSTDVPHMTDEEVEVLTELAFLFILPAYRHITLMTYQTVIDNLTPEYKTYVAQLVKLRHRLDAHGHDELATDEDWVAWMESM